MNKRRTKKGKKKNTFRKINYGAHACFASMIPAGCKIFQVHGLLHLLGFDHEISEEAEAEMKKAEELLSKNLGWKEKGLIKSASDAENNGCPHIENPDGSDASLLVPLPS